MISNNTITNNYYFGIHLGGSTGTTLTGNVLTGNGGGLLIGGGVSNSSIYNNYFNNTDNVLFLSPVEEHSGTNAWNVTAHEGPNIVGGPSIGGNYYTTPNGTGVSQTCADRNGDGFCDTANGFEANGPPIDKLPVALPKDPTLPRATNASATTDVPTIDPDIDPPRVIPSNAYEHAL